MLYSVFFSSKQQFTDSYRCCLQNPDIDHLCAVELHCSCSVLLTEMSWLVGGKDRRVGKSEIRKSEIVFLRDLLT